MRNMSNTRFLEQNISKYYIISIEFIFYHVNRDIIEQIKVDDYYKK